MNPSSSLRSTNSQGQQQGASVPASPVPPPSPAAAPSDEGSGPPPPTTTKTTAQAANRPQSVQDGGIKRVYLGVNGSSSSNSSSENKNDKQQQQQQQQQSSASSMSRSPSSDSGSEADSFLGHRGAAASASASGSSASDSDDVAKDAVYSSEDEAEKTETPSSPPATSRTPAAEAAAGRPRGQEEKTEHRPDKKSVAEEDDGSVAGSEGEGARMLIEGLERILVATDANDRKLNVAQVLLKVHDRLNDMTLQLTRLVAQQQQQEHRQKQNSGRANAPGGSGPQAAHK